MTNPTTDLDWADESAQAFNDDHAAREQDKQGEANNQGEVNPWNVVGGKKDQMRQMVPAARGNDPRRRGRQPKKDKKNTKPSTTEPTTGKSERQPEEQESRNDVKVPVPKGQYKVKVAPVPVRNAWSMSKLDRVAQVTTPEQESQLSSTKNQHNTGTTTNTSQRGNIYRGGRGR